MFIKHLAGEDSENSGRIREVRLTKANATLRGDDISISDGGSLHARSAPSAGPDQASSCRSATPRPCSSISTTSPPRSRRRAHAILIFDQAGWHGAKALKTPPNLSLMPLPPRSPELNPQENIWQFMRANWLSNRVFKSYDDIVDHCCFAWNTLVDQPWKIMSIARRDWAIISQSL